MAWEHIQSEFSRIENSSGELTKHLSNLAGAHKALITSELKEQRGRLIIASSCLVGGVALVFCALFALTIALAEALSNDGSTMSLGSAYALVALLMAIAASAALVAGIQYLKKFSPVPREGIQSFKETLSCLVKRHL